MGARRSCFWAWPAFRRPRSRFGWQGWGFRRTTEGELCMHKKSGLKFVPAVVAAGAVALMGLSNGCSSSSGGPPPQCDGLDVKVRAQATLKAYAEAAFALKAKAAEV